jgi:hypothetical protein
MSHPNIVVLNCVFLYAKAIHYLFHNHKDQDRNFKAFEYAYELS